MTRQDAITYWLGKRGDADSETVIVANNSEAGLRIWSNRGMDIAAILRRLGDRGTVECTSSDFRALVPWSESRSVALLLKMAVRQGPAKQKRDGEE